MIPFPLFDAQVRFLESCWFSEEGELLLGGNGENLRSQYFEEETLKRSTYPEHYAHRMHDGMQWEYLTELERLTFSGVPENVKESMEVSRKFYEHAWTARFENPLGYKKEELMLGDSPAMGECKSYINR